MSNSTVFLRIKEERKRLKLTQKRMAALGGVGLRAQQHYESGDRTPDIKYLESLDKSAEIDFDFGYVISGQRRADLELECLPPEQKGMAVVRRVLDAEDELGISLGRQGTKELCQYVYQYCPTEGQVKELVKSVYAVSKSMHQEDFITKNDNQGEML
ncbi:MAG: helix-turn-helix domain-containing protein [Methylomarinum sp.]|nr:helix-turn-helix domain-containing protein [Methylomarinum sp.]